MPEKTYRVANHIFQAGQFLRFYLSADTKFQIHSPFVFELVERVVEDDRDFYAFADIDFIRHQLSKNTTEIELTDFGAGRAGANGEQPGIRVSQRVSSVREIARLSGCPDSQGRQLFKLVDWLKPKRMLELGTSLGISSLYLGTAARSAGFITLEGCRECASIARHNLDALGLKKADVRVGAFEQTLAPALADLHQVDLVYFDGNHRREPTVKYFETCLPFASERAVFLFDDIHWSPGMAEAWADIQKHPQVTLTVDLFGFGMVFFRKENLERQHFRVMASGWKPWKVF